MDGQTDKLMPSRLSRLLSTAWRLGDLVSSTGSDVPAWIGRREVGREGQEGGDRGMMKGTWDEVGCGCCGSSCPVRPVCPACLATLAVWLAGSGLAFPNLHPHYCPRRSGWFGLAGRNRLGPLVPLFSLVLSPLISHLLLDWTAALFSDNSSLMSSGDRPVMLSPTLQRHAITRQPGCWQ